MHWAVIPAAAPQHNNSPAGAAAAAAARRQLVAQQEQIHRSRLSGGNVSNHRPQWSVQHGCSDSAAGRALRQLAALKAANSYAATDMLGSSSNGSTSSIKDGGGGGGSDGSGRALRQIVEVRAAFSKSEIGSVAAGGAQKARGASWLSETDSQHAVRAAFYLWVSAANLVGMSTMWARAADAFDPSAAARCNTEVFRSQ